ncbi:MAG: hypothetical protein ACRDAX_03255 [Propionibacteriaceae bacterium]
MSNPPWKSEQSGGFSGNSPSFPSQTAPASIPQPGFIGANQTAPYRTSPNFPSGSNGSGVPLLPGAVQQAQSVQYDRFGVPTGTEIIHDAIHQQTAEISAKVTQTGRRIKRFWGRTMPIVALGSGMAASLLMGFSVKAALSSITFQPSVSSLAGFTNWLSIASGTAVVLVPLFVLCLICLAKSRRKLLSTFALVVTLFMPLVAALIGLRFGISDLMQHFDAAKAQVAAAGAGDIAQNLKDLASTSDIGKFRPILDFIIKLVG